MVRLKSKTKIRNKKGGTSRKPNKKLKCLKQDYFSKLDGDLVINKNYDLTNYLEYVLSDSNFCFDERWYWVIKNMIHNGTITNKKTVYAMLKTNRDYFCCYLPYNCEICLVDRPYPRLGENQTISAPHMHARAIETILTKLVYGNNILDVGCGSGYLVAAFSYLVNANSYISEQQGIVHGIDLFQSLVDRSYTNLIKFPDLKDHISIVNNKNINNKNIKLFTADAWTWDGIDIEYDAIHIGAGVNQIPQNLWKLLKNDGLMVLPIKQINGESFQVYRKTTNDSIHTPIGTGIKVRYVPLLKLCSSNNPNRRCHNIQINS